MFYCDVVIGEMSNICSANTVWINGDTTLFQNSNEYWIDHLCLNGEMKIAKNTDEGKKIASMIENKTSSPKILSYLNQVFLKNCDSEKLQEKIKDFGKSEFDRGRQDKAEEIYKVLGI